MSDLRDRALKLLKEIEVMTLMKKHPVEIEHPVLPVKSLLVLSLRNSAQNHVELTRQLSPETHDAAKRYYALLCAECCESIEKYEQEELVNVSI